MYGKDRNSYSHVFPAEDWLFNVADAQIVLEEAFCYILIIYVPCQTVCIVNSVNCPEGEGYVLLLSPRTGGSRQYSVQLAAESTTTSTSIYYAINKCNVDWTHLSETA